MAATQPITDTLPDPIQVPGPRRAPRPKPVRRTGKDRSQAFRRASQVLFLVLNLYLGVQFVLFVRQFEVGGSASTVARPAGVEGWLPIAGLMNLKYFLWTGAIPEIHPAAMFLLIAFLLVSCLLHKAFCGWLCPVGTLSEGLWKLGRKILGTNWTMPRWLDIPLRGLKYLLLGFFLYAVAGMSVAALQAFLASPYGLVADVKMLYFFRNLSATAAVTLAALALLSVFFQNFWCRYLCPYGALMGLAALFSPAKIRRDTDRCVDCAACAKACPALLPVDKLITVQSAECMACLECVAACPTNQALELVLPRKRRLPPWAVAAAIAALFLGTVGYAKWIGGWDSSITQDTYRQILPMIGDLRHP